MIIATDYFDSTVSLSLLCFSVISLMLNSLSVYILTRAKFLKESMFRYFLVNELVSTFGLSIVWLHLIPLITNWDIPLIFCPFHELVLYTCNSFYPWISVLNSIDRLLSLKYHGRFKFIKKFKYQFLAISLIFISSILINIPRLFYSGFSNVTICFINDFQIGLYVNTSNLFLSVLVPFFIMLYSTIAILYYMITQKRRLKQNLINYRREKDFARSVLSMDLWFLLCYSPFSVLPLYQSFYNKPIHEESLKIFVLITVVLMFSEMSFNFFVYLLCNKQFRNYFSSMIGFCRKNTRIRQTNVYR